MAKIGLRARLLAAAKGRARRIRNTVRDALRAESATPAGDDAAGRASRREQEYRQAIATYVPRPFAGPVTLVVAEDGGDARPDLKWRAVAPNVRIHVTPGDHVTCVSRHAVAVGEFLAECLEAVQSNVSHLKAAE